MMPLSSATFRHQTHTIVKTENLNLEHHYEFDSARSEKCPRFVNRLHIEN